MRKSIGVLFVVLLIISLCACSGGQSNKRPTNKQDDNSAASESNSVDVDLTVLSRTMVYSEIYNIMTAPDNYMGKKIKMKGDFAVYRDASTGNMYYACVIADATACCSQGLEFTLSGDHSYPQDYPDPGTEITVVGEFETYEENGFKYCRLIQAKMV